MRSSISLLTTLLVIVEIKLITYGLRFILPTDQSLTTFVFTFLWIALQRPIGFKSATMGVLFPFMFGICATVYQTNLSLRYDLIHDLLCMGNRQLANSLSLDLFANYYCPVFIFGYYLQKIKLSIIHDLARYGLWKFLIVRHIVELLVQILVLIGLCSEIFHKIRLGFQTRYINIDSWFTCMKYVLQWSPVLLRSVLQVSIARGQYLKTSGIGLYKVNQSEGFRITCIEKAIALLTVSTALLLFSTHWNLGLTWLSQLLTQA